VAGPIEQFQIKPIVPIEIGGLDLSFTNSSLWMVVATAVTVVFFSLARSRPVRFSRSRPTASCETYEG